MPYVGFHPDIDPGHDRAVKGGRKLRKWVMEVIPEQSTLYRLRHRSAERFAHGRHLVADLIDERDHVPNRIRAYGYETRVPLVVYYRTPWPVGPQPWPNLAPPVRENP